MDCLSWARTCPFYGTWLFNDQPSPLPTPPPATSSEEAVSHTLGTIPGTLRMVLTNIILILILIVIFPVGLQWRELRGNYIPVLTKKKLKLRRKKYESNVPYHPLPSLRYSFTWINCWFGHFFKYPTSSEKGVIGKCIQLFME